MTQRGEAMRIGQAVVAVLALYAGAVQAGPYSDDLAKCLVESTTAADKNALVKWMFATAALHPAVKSIASVTDAERAQSTRSTAELFEKLLTESCRTPAQQAVKYEGAAALQTGFQMLGQVAARELFADPGVTHGLAELENYIDSQKIEQALAPKQ
jgi:predicted GNAT family N-acyltransferase